MRSAAARDPTAKVIRAFGHRSRVARRRGVVMTRSPSPCAWRIMIDLTSSGTDVLRVIISRRLLTLFRVREDEAHNPRLPLEAGNTQDPLIDKSSAVSSGRKLAGDFRNGTAASV